MDKKTPQWNSSHPLDPIDTKTIFFIAGVRRRNLSLSLSLSLSLVIFSFISQALKLKHEQNKVFD
jgi:hypothetical protein